MECPCNPTTRELETGGSLGLAGQPSQPSWWVLNQREILSSKRYWIVPEEHLRLSSSLYIHAHVHLSMYTLTYILLSLPPPKLEDWQVYEIEDPVNQVVSFSYFPKAVLGIPLKMSVVEGIFEFLSKMAFQQAWWRMFQLWLRRAVVGDYHRSGGAFKS